ncbi:MAG: glycosyltransferase family 9 protein [Phycisphaerales bacterium]|nr:MAG: glycosyltransferase family 9 protein [Phycisphaerales bacterium]
MLRKKGAEAARNMQRGLIVQPGAIGDCILTLPLASFMKDALRLGGIDLLGHTQYSGILPGRSCIDGVRSLDSMDLHRLYVRPEAFELGDPDPLITAFADYAWIATFLGESDSHFEQNLIFTANCSHSAEVLTLCLKPPEDCCEHVIDFHIRQLVTQCGLPPPPSVQTGDCLIRATEADIETGRRLLTEGGFEPGSKLVAIHPGSGGAGKCWCLENFLAIAAELASEGVEVAFLLGPAESDKLGNTAIREQMSRVGHCLSGLSLADVLRLLSCVDGFVGNDSGITHLAAAMGVRTLAVFGPTNPAVYKPVGPEATVFSSSSPTFAQRPSARLQRKLLTLLTT